MRALRRLGPTVGRGVVASAALLVPAALLAGCDAGPGEVSITAYDVSATDRATCEDLIADLPDQLAGEDRVDVEAGALGAAWGEAPYVLTCGVPEPEGYEPTAECSVIAGVGWYVPEDQVDDLGEDVTAVALSLKPYVEVRVPPEHRTEGVDRALTELAPSLKADLAEGLPCL